MGTALGGSIGGAGTIDPGGKNKLGGASIHPGGGGGTSLGGPQRPLLRSGKLKPGGNSAGRGVGSPQEQYLQQERLLLPPGHCSLGANPNKWGRVHQKIERE